MTAAAGGAALQNICIRARQGNSYPGFAQTTSSGTYSVTGLAPGGYTVQFEDCSQKGYLTEWYNQKADQASANPVTVTAGTTTSGIDAQLTVGGTISGTVRDASAAPVSNLCVNAQPQVNGGSSAFTNTDAHGQYTLVGLSTGSYSVAFASCNSPYLRQWYNGKSTQSNADPVQVVTGQATTGIDVQVVLGGTVSGTVTDTSSAPLSQVCVSAQTQANGGSNASSSTDSQGHYTLVGLVTGSYVVSFGGCGSPYARQWYNGKTSASSADVVQVVTGAATTKIDAQLIIGGTISGTVTDASNHPLINICVSAEQAGQGQSANTDAAGHYTIKSLLTGSYLVRFSDCSGHGYIGQYYNNKPDQSTANPVSVTAGAATSGIDATLTLSGSISGLVADTSNAPVAGACVYAYLKAGGSYGGSTSTDSAGHYSMKSVAAGTYVVQFRDCAATKFALQWFNNKASQSAANPVTVAIGADTPGIDAHLALAGSIGGTVTNASGVGVANLCVSAQPAGDGSSGSATTDSSGHYTIGGLNAGWYRVQFGGCGSSIYVQQWYRGEGDFSSADLVDVASGQTTSAINAQMVEGGTITGAVTDTSGSPLNRVCVYAWPPGGFSTVASSQTDASGHYTMVGVPPGPNNVDFRDCSGGNGIEQWYSGKADRASADPVTVTGGATTPNINAALATGGSITGTVADAHGAPANSICVSARLTASSSSGSGGYTDQSGRYTIRGLPTGSYRVSFHDCNAGGDLLDAWYKNKSTFAAATPVAVTAGAADLRGRPAAVGGRLDLGHGDRLKWRSSSSDLRQCLR